MDDFTSKTNTKGFVAIGGSTVGHIEKLSDGDWLRLELEAGQTYQIDVKSFGDDPLSNPQAFLKDANRTTLAYDNNGGDDTDARIIFTPDETGSYFVQVNQNGKNDTGAYEVSLNEVLAEPEPEPTIADLDLMVIGDSFSVDFRGLQPKLEAAIEAGGQEVDSVIDLAKSGRSVYGAKAAVDDYFADASNEIPEVAILAIGINDALKERPLINIEVRLNDIIDTLQEQGIEVVLARPEPFFDLKAEGLKGYDTQAERDAFIQLYHDIAEEQDVILVDDFLSGLTDNPNLLEDDLFHPNEEGVDQIVSNLLPEVQQAIEALEPMPSSPSVDDIVVSEALV